MRENSTAGLGDPYWYEWSVGQKYVIEMLFDDSQIASVTLQKSGTNGLDDVVVKYASGDARFIQVKHTRVGATLTFGDLVSTSEAGGRPLLQQMAESWDAADKASTGKCEAWLVTNRHAGFRSASAREGSKVVRPPLAEFLET